MILASKSPRRKEILEMLDFTVKIHSVDIEEVSDKVNVVSKIEDIAEKKAIAVVKDYPNEYILAADTVVLIDEKILGKPQNAVEAKDMLREFSNREHQVCTAYCIINFNKNLKITSHSLAKVKFRNLTAELIEWYVSTQEPFDKAGAYGIQGKGAILVDKIEGDFFTIMGLPISRIVEDFSKLGIGIDELKKI